MFLELDGKRFSHGLFFPKNEVLLYATTQFFFFFFFGFKLHRQIRIDRRDLVLEEREQFSSNRSLACLL